MLLANCYQIHEVKSPQKSVPQHCFILKGESGSHLFVWRSLTGVIEVEEAVSLRQKNKRGQVEQLVVSQMLEMKENRVKLRDM